MKTVSQCKSCPWRVDCQPDVDIPNGYSRDLHESLRDTIAEPGAFRPEDTCRVMACHYSPVGEEFPCAGWLHHQLGDGNNIGLRLRVLRGDMPVPEVDGDQHRTFENTLPMNKKRRLPKLPRVPVPRPQQSFRTRKDDPFRKRKHKGKED